MNKLNVTFVAGLLAVAAVLGTVAATHTVSLGTAHRQTADAAVRTRTGQLDRFEAALRRELMKKPPRLPAVPKPKPPVASRPAAAAAPQQVIYRRPPAVVVVKHTHHGDDGGHGSEGGGDGGGGDD